MAFLSLSLSHMIAHSSHYVLLCTHLTLHTLDMTHTHTHTHTHIRTTHTWHTFHTHTHTSHTHTHQWEYFIKTHVVHKWNVASLHLKFCSIIPSDPFYFFVIFLNFYIYSLHKIIYHTALLHFHPSSCVVCRTSSRIMTSTWTICSSHRSSSISSRCVLVLRTSTKRFIWLKG